MVFYIIIVVGVVVFWEVGRIKPRLRKSFSNHAGGSPWSGIRNSFSGVHCDTETKVAQTSFVSEETT